MTTLIRFSQDPNVRWREILSFIDENWQRIEDGLATHVVEVEDIYTGIDLNHLIGVWTDLGVSITLAEPYAGTLTFSVEGFLHSVHQQGSTYKMRIKVDDPVSGVTFTPETSEKQVDLPGGTFYESWTGIGAIDGTETMTAEVFVTSRDAVSVQPTTLRLRGVTTAGSAGDMKKSVYDTVDVGRVDKASTVDDGVLATGAALIVAHVVTPNTAHERLHNTAGTTFPASPVDGTVFTKTDFARPNRFYWDGGLSKWLSVEMFSFEVGHRGTHNGGYLTHVASVLGSSTAGHTPGFSSITVVGMSWRADTTAAGNFELRKGGSAVAGVSLSHASGTVGADMALGVDVTANGALTIYNTGSTASAVNPIVLLYYRKRGTA